MLAVALAGPVLTATVTGRPLDDVAMTAKGGECADIATGAAMDIVCVRSGVKWATSVLLEFMRTVRGVLTPTAFPVQPVKALPGTAKADAVASAFCA
jgi:hypothetical protein